MPFMNTTAAKSEQIAYLISILKNSGLVLASKKITAGFDGFIDNIVKIIRSKEERQSPVLFKRIREFGEYVLEKEGASFSLELEEISTKPGGNMPIMANALGCLGAEVNCVGSFGYPQTHPVFKKLSPRCRLYPFADPGTATAYEFTDGKIMLAQMGALNAARWDTVKSIIGIDTLVKLYAVSDLLCIVNWSEIDASTDIWKGLLKDVFPAYASPGEKQMAFFDLSDCSKRSDESIRQAFALLKEFTQYAKVTLGLNKNEAKHIYRVLYDKPPDNDLTKLGERIFEQLNIDTLLLHSSKEALSFNEEGLFAAKGFFIDNPAISTGAGDNFNAGFCAASLLQLEPGLCLMFANSVAACYVKTGMSPGLTELVQFLEGC